jgi:RND family efflux transporter MFP subunit
MTKTRSPSSKPLGWKTTLAVCILLVVAAIGLTWLIKTTEPSAQRLEATRRTPMLVKTTKAEFGDFSPKIVVMGAVRAKNDIQLSPRISGEVTRLSPNFEPGRRVRQGEVLLEIDPMDYQNVVAQRRAELHQAKAAFDVERGYQRVAQQDYELLGDDIPEDERALALRQPQLAVAKAAVEAAQAALDQAQLDLDRAQVRAPFDAQVITREVAVGSQVSSSSAIARLVGTDAYWVTATVPLEKLHLIQFAGEDSEGSTAEVRNLVAWRTGQYRLGTVDQLIGALDSTTRLARVNVEIENPLARGLEDNAPPLLLDSLLEVTILGKPIEGVYRLDRGHLRQNDTVWLKVDNELRINPVTVVFRDAKYAYISEGIEHASEIVTSSLSSIVEGAALRTESEISSEENP